MLVAASPEAIEILQNLLGHEIEIVTSNSIEEAVALLGQNIHLVICEIYFAESRMFDFLRIAKANPITRNIPFLCFRDTNSSMNLVVYESLHIACKALGASAFLDRYEEKT